MCNIRKHNIIENIVLIRGATLAAKVNVPKQHIRIS